MGNKNPSGHATVENKQPAMCELALHWLLAVA
jgi:hypothetical protein